MGFRGLIPTQLVDLRLQFDDLLFLRYEALYKPLQILPKVSKGLLRKSLLTSLPDFTGAVPCGEKTFSRDLRVSISASFWASSQ